MINSTLKKRKNQASLVVWRRKIFSELENPNFSIWKCSYELDFT